MKKRGFTLVELPVVIAGESGLEQTVEFSEFSDDGSTREVSEPMTRDYPEFILSGLELFKDRRLQRRSFFVLRVAR